jgi:hypothetical protein
MDAVRAIADAVLYEGFLLFPYSKNALKNRMPFQFGVVMPAGYRDASEPRSFTSQFLVRHSGESLTELRGLLRFLDVGANAAEREIPFGGELGNGGIVQRFVCGGLSATIALSAQRKQGAWLVTVEVSNESRVRPTAVRNVALQKALVSAHVVFEVSGGEFVSLLDPPAAYAQLVQSCTNERFFPVLAGEGESGRQTSALLLVSPIVLYDFPKVAQASRGPTFDGTEIDQLLSLSVAALSDEERAQARIAHPQVARMVERAEAMTIAPGWRVRVHPKGRADVWDGIVDGKTARVVDVKTDVDGKRYIGVLFDDDPATEIHEWYGRSFFYGVDEVEPLT